MVYIQLAKNNPHKLSFYLAMEEYVARRLNLTDDCFFLWQVEPTVIFGRNQDIESEVNLDYCKQHGINFFRRKSGGGCVYADMSNVMSSFITNEDNVDETFARYLKMMSETLESIGLKDVHPSGHNDIMIGDKKVSGNAIYHLPGKIIAHGTLLYDTDMEHMLHAITPSKQKLSKHGVQSVRQRICLLKDFSDLSFHEIRKRIKEHLCDKVYTLNEEDEEGIKQIEQEYLQPKFIYGK